MCLVSLACDSCLLCANSSWERWTGILIVGLFPVRITEQRNLTVEFLLEYLPFPSRRKMREFKDWSESLNELSQAVLKGGSPVISRQSLLTCHVYWINKTIARYFRNVPVSVLIPFWVWMSFITFGFFSLLRIKTCKMKTAEGKFHIIKICAVDLIKLAGYNILTIELNWKYYWLIIMGPYYDLSILFHLLSGTENVMLPEPIGYPMAQRSALQVWLELVKS